MVRQPWPPSLVWNKTLAPEYSTCGSRGENSRGIVRTQRYLPARTGSGETSCTWPAPPPGALRCAVHVCPPSCGRPLTPWRTRATSGLEGATATSLTCPARPHRRASALASRQPCPPSSERYSPPPLVAPTTAYMRVGALCDVASPMRPRPSAAPGRPVPIWRQVVPPSVDRY